MRRGASGCIGVLTPEGEEGEDSNENTDQSLAQSGDGETVTTTTYQGSRISLSTRTARRRTQSAAYAVD